MKSRPEIHSVVEKVAAEEKSAIVLGFSLGALAAYTYIYEYSLLNHLPSMSFNASWNFTRCYGRSA